MTPQTTLAPNAPWPFKDDWLMVADLPQEPVPPAKVKTAPKTERPKHYKPKVIKSETLDALRTHLSANPGQSMAQIRRSLGWSQNKAESVVAMIRAEVVNGYVLRSSLIEIKKVKP
jgi:hypothetical protein